MINNLSIKVRLGGALALLALLLLSVGLNSLSVTSDMNGDLQALAALANSDLQQAKKAHPGQGATLNRESGNDADATAGRKERQLADAAAAADRHYRQQRMWTICFMLMGVGAAVVLGYVLMSSITGALNKSVEVAEKIAAGQLDNTIKIRSQDEFGRLLTSLRSMDSKISEIVSNAKKNAGAVRDTARQISQGNDDLSQRTQEQAAALEQTAASMEQMTATVKQNADNARHANQLATSAREHAEKGGEVVQRAVRAMNEINSSSRKIADIIGVIDEIAFQTNLLALNAAVEAARAGEQGRGFAVVATEVRNLAQRSASAAKEIKGLINDSVSKVKAGSDLVDESGRTLSGIVDEVKKVTDIVAEIRAASEEQASGIQQVNNSITQMDQTTQQNAALVEQSAASSRSMVERATELSRQVSYFRTSANGVAETPRDTAATFPAASRSPAATPARRSATAAPQQVFARASGDDSSWQEF